METTDWDSYGTGNYEKCANCMAHCGYEPTAAADALAHPLKALLAGIRGPRTTGPMAPEISLANQRPAKYIFESQVQDFMKETHKGKDTNASSKEAAKKSLAQTG